MGNIDLLEAYDKYLSSVSGIKEGKQCRATWSQGWGTIL